MDRLLTVREVCRLLRRTSTWFYTHRSELEAVGFPEPVPIVGRYDGRAIAAWLDRQSGSARGSTNDKVMERFARWGKSA
jgi:hypothetical protein